MLECISEYIFWVFVVVHIILICVFQSHEHDMWLCCFRDCHADVRLADVCKNGHFPGNSVQEAWQTRQGGSVLQCESLPVHMTLYSSVQHFVMYEYIYIYIQVYFQHCLPLPGFLLLSTDIYKHAVLFSQSCEYDSEGNNVVHQSSPLKRLGSGRIFKCLH